MTKNPKKYRIYRKSAVSINPVRGVLNKRKKDTELLKSVII